VISASRLAMAAAVVLAIGTLVALPDLMRGAGGGPIRVVEISSPIEDDGAGDGFGSGGDTSSPKRVTGGGPSGGGEPKSSADGQSRDDSTASDTGSPASAPAEQSSGAPSSGAAGGAYSSDGGDGDGGEGVDDQPVEVNPVPAQPAAPPTANDASGVDDIDETESEVAEPEAEVAG
jgi:hypothetical protein